MSLRILHVLDHSAPLHSGYAFRTLSILRDELQKKLAEQGTQLQREQQQYQAQVKLTEDAQLRADILTRQLAALRDEMARLNAALEASEAKSKEQQVQIADLGRRLNLALASKVEELARYRSEFFGRLREVGRRCPHTSVIDTFLIYSRVGSFPVDIRHNSKIFREKLAVWADKTLGKRWNPGDNSRVQTPAGSGAAT